jgi:hypothetical protein
LIFIKIKRETAEEIEKSRHWSRRVRQEYSLSSRLRIVLPE